MHERLSGLQYSKFTEYSVGDPAFLLTGIAKKPAPLMLRVKKKSTSVIVLLEY